MELDFYRGSIWGVYTGGLNINNLLVASVAHSGRLILASIKTMPWLYLQVPWTGSEPPKKRLCAVSAAL